MEKKNLTAMISDEEANLRVMILESLLKKRPSAEIKSRIKREVKQFTSVVKDDNLRKIVGDSMTLNSFKLLNSLKAKTANLTFEPPKFYAQGTNVYHKEYLSNVKAVAKQIENVSDSRARASAEIFIREESRNANKEGMLTKGVKLVWISSHANCSKRCEPYQGKLYSLDGTSGSIDGESYRPLEVATNNYYITKKGKKWINGCTSGFNCRHYLIEYDPLSKPKAWSASTVSRVRKVEEKQRYFEREIRKNKMMNEVYKLLNAKSEANKYRIRAIKLNKQYEAFSRSNEIAFYRERTRNFK